MNTQMRAFCMKTNDLSGKCIYIVISLHNLLHIACSVQLLSLGPGVDISTLVVAFRFRELRATELK